MKKILFLAAVLAMAGCSDFLDRPAQGQRTEDDFLGDPSATSGLTNSIYEVYRVSDPYLAIGLWLPDLMSDNGLRGSSMSDGGGIIYTNAVNQFQNLSGLNGTSGFLGDNWNRAYRGIDRANEVVKALEGFPDMPARQKEIVEAEARFNRAMFYFDVLRQWGKGPIMPLDELTGAQMADMDIATSTELYDYIVADLENALNMPAKAEAAEWYSTGWYGRAHKGSAQGLLAKVLLHRASDDPANARTHYQRVVELVSQMQASSDGYSLIDIDDLWVEAGEYGAESVFEIGVASFMEKNGSFQGWQLVGTRGTPNWGWGFIAPSLNLIESFETGDKRKDWTVIYGQTSPFSGMLQTPSVIDGTTVKGEISTANLVGNGYPNRFIRKFYQPRPVVGGNENYGGNIRKMRWAEVLLIGAEAAAELGDEKAQGWLDAVRSRAGLASVPATKENIWEEKRIEMAMEQERWFDLVRIDKKNAGYFAEKVWNKIQSEYDGLAWMKANHPEITPAEAVVPLPPGNPVQTPKHYVLPVPNSQIILMNKLTQNSDY